MPLFKWFLLLGCINAFLAVALGAFAAHGLKTRLTADMLAVFQTGTHYHLYHGLGLLLTGLVMTQLPATDWAKWSGWLMLTGIVLFSGSLYLLATGLPRWLGMITPFGGLSFILAWTCLAIAVVKS